MVEAYVEEAAFPAGCASATNGAGRTTSVSLPIKARRFITQSPDPLAAATDCHRKVTAIRSRQIPYIIFGYLPLIAYCIYPISGSPHRN